MSAHFLRGRGEGREGGRGEGRELGRKQVRRIKFLFSVEHGSDVQHATEHAHGMRPLYLDMQATTPMVRTISPSRSPSTRVQLLSFPLTLSSQDPRVLDAMLPYLVSYYGNPHSQSHAYGWESEHAVEHARMVRKGGGRQGEREKGRGEGGRQEEREGGRGGREGDVLGGV